MFPTVISKIPKTAIIPLAGLAWWNYKGIQWYTQRKRGYANFSSPEPMTPQQLDVFRKQRAGDYYRRTNQ